MRIGELARRTGASVRSLRYYEEQGLLVSTRSTSGQRHYDDTEVERVQFLKLLYGAGLSSTTIAELLPCAVTPSVRNSDLAFDRLLTERARIDVHIDELVRTREALDVLIEANLAHRATLVEATAAAVG